MDLTGEPGGEAAEDRRRLRWANIFNRALMASIAIRPPCASAMATGQGAHIDMALLDSLTGVLANQADEFSRLGARAPERDGQCPSQYRALSGLSGE